MSFLHFIFQIVAVYTISNRLYIVYHSNFCSFRSGNGQQGKCAYSEFATKNETLVNESIIVVPLFNVKICDVLYLKCCT